MQSWCRAQTVLWRKTVYFLINWHWNFTFLSCILVAWPSYLVILLVQIFFHQEFLRVSSDYCEKLLVHSDFSPDVALSQTVVPPGLCSEFLLPLETKVWYIYMSVHNMENSTTSVISNTEVVNAVWPWGWASESQVHTISDIYQLVCSQIHPSNPTRLSQLLILCQVTPRALQIPKQHRRPTRKVLYAWLLFLLLCFSQCTAVHNLRWKQAEKKREIIFFSLLATLEKDWKENDSVRWSFRILWIC